MKIGIISDIHCNIDALKTVFNKFESENIDKIICVGDVIGIGPYPAECVDLLMQNRQKFLTFIKGNHEGYLLKGLPKNSHDEANGKPLSLEELNMFKWNHGKLNNNQIEFIKTWDDKKVLEIEGKKIVVEHYPIDSKGKFKKFCAHPTYEQIDDLFEDKDADILIFGHTHNQLYYNQNNKVYINSGSLGCPVNTNGASVGILEINGENVKYEQLVLKYDVDKVINDINKLNYPVHSLMIKIFYRR